MILAVHHLYNKSTYPELAAEQDNLLVIKQEIHQEFHCWHEGFDKPCTISDFISFIKLKYSGNHVLLSQLNERKKTLETKLKPRSKFLALPAPSPTPPPASVPIEPSKTEPSKTQETNTTLFEKVKEIVKEQLDVEEDKITPEANFIDDLGADSLDKEKLVMALEEKFEVEIPDEDAENLNTVQDVVNYIKKNAANE
ncbi:acyl carrier protein [Planktothrix sp. FACHB-1365]|nr:acyl carrier protein [Planktothrix sp. FACHB-1365]